MSLKSSKDVKYIVDKNDIDDNNFFRSLINICYRNNLINERDLQNVGYQRMDMLKTVMTYYTRNESSSISVEDAESILENVDYIIGIYLRELNDMQEILTKLTNESIEHMFSKGRVLIKRSFEKNKKMLNYIQKNKIICDNMTYNETIDYGLEKFFKCYDDLFRAHIAPCDVDYQLCQEVNNYSGILYIDKYLDNLNLENEFCRYFDNENIVNLLNGYDKEYHLLLINIFEIVLTNSLGLILCRKLPYSLNITDNDIQTIKEELNHLSCAQIKEKLIQCSVKLKRILDIKDDKIVKYISKAIEKISINVYESIQIDKLDRIFISFKKYEQKIDYNDDKQRLPDKMFRKIIDEIRDITDINIKIKYINKNIKSITDLRDMLSLDCFFKDEYYKYFGSLNIIQIALLYKYIEQFNDNNEWAQYFKNYIDKLSEQEKYQINTINKKIEFN